MEPSVKEGRAEVTHVELQDMNIQQDSPRRRSAGVTLLEMLVVISILLILAGFSVYNLLPAIRMNRIENALQATLLEVRNSRQLAIDERRVHVVTFVLPNIIQTDRIELDGTRNVIRQVPLTPDVAFQAELGIPTGPAAVPDGFGNGGQAINFNGSDEIYFQADGSAHDAIGRVVNGVVYLSFPGELMSSRAVSLFGATGRLKAWKLVDESGSPVWH
jgi:prepilin-type N-terminal cleavage/methylation domain-containing protein